MDYWLQIWAKLNIGADFIRNRVYHQIIGWFFLKLHCEHFLENVSEILRNNFENFLSVFYR